MTLISIIIPVYNAEKTIEDTINSIVKQKFKNYEIILVNDGSTDRTGEVISSLTKRFDNLKVFQQKNSGPLIARNKGISEAKGEYLMFVDADDYLAEGSLNQINRFIQDNDYDMYIFKWMVRFRNTLQEQKPTFNHLQSFSSTNKELIYNEILKSSKLNSLAIKIFKRDLVELEEFNNFKLNNIKHGEDLILSLQAFNNAESIIYLDIPWYIYVQNSESTTYTFNTSKYQDIKIIDEILHFYSDNWNIPEEIVDEKLNLRYLINIVKLIPTYDILKSDDTKGVYGYLNKIASDAKFQELIKLNQLHHLDFRYKLLLKLLYYRQFRLVIFLKSLNSLQK